MKQLKKVFIISFLLIFVILFVATPYIYAADKKNDKQEETTESSYGLDLGELDKYKSEETDLGTLQDKANGIIGVITTIGVVVSVISLIAIGIKYMLGSVEEKAEYKETLKPYLIGAFLVFTVSLVPQLIYQFMQNLN